MRFKIFGSMVLAAVAAGLTASAAQASFMAQFQADGAGPIATLPGSSGYIGPLNVLDTEPVTVGTFNIASYTAQSNSGTSQTPQISAFAVDITNTASTGHNILTINLWDTGFSPPGSPLPLAGSGSVTFNAATNGDFATYVSGADPSNSQDSLTYSSPQLVQTPLSTATYSGGNLPETVPLNQETTTFSPSGLFSMGNQLELSLAGGSNVTLSYTTTAIPEPATLGLLAVGGLGLLLKRKRKGKGSA